MSSETDATYNCRVWGFADLHTHPATHLGFGADENGNNGLRWGKPADDDALNVLTTSKSLGPCDTSTHNPGAIDLVQQQSDSKIMNMFQAGTVHLPYTDNGQGDNSFASWPASVSILHEQMDITGTRRAFEGGLRLLFVSVTDDELISALWNQKFNALGQSPPVHDPKFDLNRAVVQLSYIQNLIAANSSWMQIVTTPFQARQAINTGHLAVVLSLELDNLSPSDIQYLVQNFNVRHVIPIHLTDNPWYGGTAVYMDQFNSENNFFIGSFYDVSTDNNVNFQLGTPQVLAGATISSAAGGVTGAAVDIGGGILIALGATGPFGWLVDSILVATGVVAVFNSNNLPNGAFGYAPVAASNPPTYPTNDVNSIGLNKTNFRALMQMQCGNAPCALLLDVAHMGERSAGDALDLAELYNYPLMDSHTGLRCDGLEAPSPVTQVSCQPGSSSELPALPSPNSPGSPQINERSLPLSQLLRISKLGGVIGLGLVSGGEGSGGSDPDPVATWAQNYATALSFMGGHSVALGSDTNGLSPLIQSDPPGTQTYQPITVQASFGPPAGDAPMQQFASALQQFSLGQKNYLLQQDGIASYGLLPDFIQGVWNAIQGTIHGTATRVAGADSSTVQALYNSAEDTIEMWEKVAAAEPLIPPAGTNQVATRCSISAVGQWVAGVNTFQIGNPINFYVDIFDQNGQPLTFPTQVSYSGNVPGVPSPRMITGMDTFTFTPQAVATYTLTATVSSSSTFSCTDTLALPPVLNGVTSPVSPGNLSDWTVLANTDGTTQLTLTGTGFRNVTSVTIGSTSIPVKPSSDTSLQVNAPAYSGPLYQNVPIYVSAAGGLASDTLEIQYFTPGVPVVDAFSGGSCDGSASFTVEAFVPDSQGNTLRNVPIQFTVGGISVDVNTNQTFGEADLTRSFSSLMPAGSATYSGAATYQSHSTTFAVARPNPLILSCHGLGQLVSKLPTGPILSGGVCLACRLTDLPDYFNDSKYYVDDLMRLGALLPVQDRLFPEYPVSYGEFLFALRQVISPVLARQFGAVESRAGRMHAAITLDQATQVVASLALPGQNSAAPTTRIAALGQASFLRPEDVAISPAHPLTRAQMVELLWHLAKQGVTPLAH
jgi:microsomal dipeptidase-like Zn-dependent dipeptidase